MHGSWWQKSMVEAVAADPAFAPPENFSLDDCRSLSLSLCVSVFFSLYSCICAYTVCVSGASACAFHSQKKENKKKKRETNGKKGEKNTVQFYFALAIQRYIERKVIASSFRYRYPVGREKSTLDFVLASTFTTSTGTCSICRAQHQCICNVSQRYHTVFQPGSNSLTNVPLIRDDFDIDLLHRPARLSDVCVGVTKYSTTHQSGNYETVLAR